eukprot:3713062-Pleurochrysis_carterae.AAC.1
MAGFSPVLEGCSRLLPKMQAIGNHVNGWVRRVERGCWQGTSSYDQAAGHRRRRRLSLAKAGSCSSLAIVIHELENSPRGDAMMEWKKLDKKFRAKMCRKPSDPAKFEESAGRMKTD